MPEPTKPVVATLFSRRMIVALLMGFSCGLPLLLTLGVLQAWMTEEGVDLTWVGMITLVQSPYSWKFLWAPVLDRFTPPFLGRRRGWLLVAQLALMAAIAVLAFADPVKRPVWMVAAAVLVAFFSATQDAVVDAYRREDLPDAELGLGSSLYVYGYRIGMWAASGGGLILADHMPFSQVYLVMAAGMLPGMLTTLLAPEPRVGQRSAAVAAGGHLAAARPIFSAVTAPSGSWPSSCFTRSATPWPPPSASLFISSSVTPSPRSARWSSSSGPGPPSPAGCSAAS